MTRNLAINCFKSERVMYTCFERETKRNIQKKVQRIVIHPEYKKLQNPVVEIYFISHRQPTVFIYRQLFRRLSLAVQPAYFQRFLRTPPFFSALIVTKAVLFVQVARHFPIHHDAYPTCVFFFCEKVDQHFQTRPSHYLHYDESRILKI